MIISADGTYTFSTVQRSGWKALTLAGTWTGSVDVQQDGISFQDLDAVTTPTRYIIAASHGSPITLVVSGGMTGEIKAKLSEL